MRTGRVSISRVLRGDTLLTAQSQIINELFLGGYGCFLKSNNVYVVLVVFTEFELLPFVEQIKQLTAVDLKEREFGFKVSELRLNRSKSTFWR